MSAIAISSVSAVGVTAFYRVIRPAQRPDETVILRLPSGDGVASADRGSLAGVDETARLRLKQVSRQEPARPVELEDYYEPERWDGLS